LLGIFWNNPALGSSRLLQVHLLTGGGRVGGMYTGKKPSGRAQNIDKLGLVRKGPFSEEGGRGGRKKKKLFHVISEEIFKIRSSTGFLIVPEFSSPPPDIFFSTPRHLAPAACKIRQTLSLCFVIVSMWLKRDSGTHCVSPMTKKKTDPTRWWWREAGGLERRNYN